MVMCQALYWALGRYARICKILLDELADQDAAQTSKLRVQ